MICKLSMAQDGLSRGEDLNGGSCPGESGVIDLTHCEETARRHFKPSNDWPSCNL